MVKTSKYFLKKTDIHLPLIFVYLMKIIQRLFGSMCPGTNKISIMILRSRMFITSCLLRGLNLIFQQPPNLVIPQNLKFNSSNQVKSQFFFRGKSLVLKEKPDHSHMMMMLGEFFMVSFMPSRHSISILSTSIRAKLTTVPLGSTLSTRSTSTSSVQTGALLIVLFVKIYEPPVLTVATEICPFVTWFPPATLYALVIGASPFKQIFLSIMLQERLQGSNTNNFPLSPTTFPRTTASRPT